MTAVIVAMLAIVVLATGVLAAVGGYHHLARSRRMRRRIRRWRYVTFWRVYDWRESGFRTMRVLRRSVAERLSRPASRPRPIRHPVPR